MPNSITTGAGGGNNPTPTSTDGSGLVSALKFPGLTLLDVYAPWAGPCKPGLTLSHALTLDLGREKFQYLSIDCTLHREAFGVWEGRSAPLFVLYGNKTLMGIVVGPDLVGLEKVVRRAEKGMGRVGKVEVRVPVGVDDEGRWVWADEDEVEAEEDDEKGEEVQNEDENGTEKDATMQGQDGSSAPDLAVPAEPEEAAAVESDAQPLPSCTTATDVQDGCSPTPATPTATKAEDGPISRPGSTTADLPAPAEHEPSQTTEEESKS